MAGPRRGRVFLFVGALAVAAGLAAVYIRYAPRRTPEGQPALTSLSGGDLGPFEAAFDAGEGSTRILAMLSPT